ncbi:MAG TPA: DUF2127 domain-containing protein [Patescibacteria group bacterium]|jgi:uncharacterized membrane protein|nr:DUF2127 domain-containing protein [Patescibacteria group bacterium]
MSWYHPSTLLDKIFEAGILIKGIHGALEFLGGLILFFVSPDVIHQFVVWTTQREVLEDPNDKIANILLGLTHHLNGGNRIFLIAYLWVHALTKLIAVIGILRNILWAYPFSLITLGLFMLYQMYHIYLRFSVGLTLITLFDVFILWLIWREYGIVKARPTAKTEAS